MKTKLLLQIFILNSLLLFCQNEKNIYGEVSPFSVIGSRTLILSSNFFTSDMRGTASVILLIDKECNLLNFAIAKISVSDKNRENVYKFWDSNVLETASENKLEKIKKNYYPLYIQTLYDLIDEVIKNLTIEYSSDTKDLKEINALILIIKIE